MNLKSKTGFLAGTLLLGSVALLSYAAGVNSLTLNMEQTSFHHLKTEEGPLTSHMRDTLLSKIETRSNNHETRLTPQVVASGSNGEIYGPIEENELIFSGFSTEHGSNGNKLTKTMRNQLNNKLSTIALNHEMRLRKSAENQKKSDCNYRGKIKLKGLDAYIIESSDGNTGYYDNYKRGGTDYFLNFYSYINANNTCELTIENNLSLYDWSKILSYAGKSFWLTEDADYYGAIMSGTSLIDESPHASVSGFLGSFQEFKFGININGDGEGELYYDSTLNTWKVRYKNGLPFVTYARENGIQWGPTLNELMKDKMNHEWIQKFYVESYFTGKYQ